MGKHIHRLLSKDIEKEVGYCSNCGAVGVKFKHGVWRCRIALNSQSRNIKGNIHKKPIGCEICGRESRLVADHDHATGIFRGWLCHSCNFMLGRAHDDPEVFERAIQYLKRGVS